MRTKGEIRILVVDDEDEERETTATLLRDEGYQVDTAASAQAALDSATSSPPDVIVADVRMPGMDGLAMVGVLRERDLDVPVIFVTGSGDVNTAVRAMRAGAAHYLLKPVDMDELSVAVQRTVENRDAQAGIDGDGAQRAASSGDVGSFEGMLGTSPAMQRLYNIAAHVAPARATVLITGESGTGKGEFARAIHMKSPCADKAFVALHCASLAETLLESELFGHEKGSFTGADRRRIGRFEQAHSGTLFLDEIGEIPASTQLKLLRVLQERTFERVGGNEPIKVDVRLIAATNRDLKREVEEKRFREDLYYRLNVVQIEMPPLRTREQDIVVLARHFLEKFSSENGKTIRGFTDAAVAKLLAHRWPGNVRELENTVERAVVLAEGTMLDAADLPIFTSNDKQVPTRPGATLAELERNAILSTLEAVDGSTARAAQILGISVRTIQYRLHEYGMAQRRGRRPSRNLDHSRTS